jgi:tape measure domain-containing protein
VLRGAANAFVDSVRSEMNAAVRSVNVRDFGNAISKMPMLPAAAPQAMLPAGRRGGALAVQSELGDFYRTVEAQVRTAFDMIADYHARSLRSFQQSYQQAIKNYHQNVLSAAAGQGLRSVQVVDLGRSQPILAGAEGGSPPRLPPAGGSGFRGGGGFVPPGGFPSDGPQGLSRPIRAPQTELPKGYLTAGKMAAALKDADQYLRQTRVPLAGAIEGLASEFASATKQVLLYGTAYKALAFFMDLPNQALSAATALQTFRNQLNAVTGSSENASRSFAFIDGLADRFAVPLESVRQGFVRMYASMEPAGFGAAEIEGLFTGVSKAAATFGMSKDQVDRVTYALSQMASKGQIMAEELRGQLGDVLPGSFALFAEAAQMSIPEFTKAMEQGRFSGEAMRAVLNNVAILLNTKFASGAEGAAKTLQGALNTMGTGLQRMYEAFEPLVNEVAQKVFPLIASAVSDATIAIKAFTSAVQGNQTAANALSGNARSIYDAMQGVAEIGKAIGSIFMQLLPTLELVGKAFLFVIEQIARFINTQFGSFLAGLTVQVLLLTAAFSALAKTGIALAIAGLINLSRQITILKAQKKALIVLSANLKLGLIALGGIAVLAAIKALADGLRGPEERLRAMQQRLAEAKKGFDDLAKAGHVAELTSQLTQARQEETAAERALLQAQARSRRTVTETGMMEPTSVSTEREELRLQETIERRVALEKSLRNAERVAAPSLPPPELQAIPPAPSDPTGGAGAADDAAREAEKRQRELERLQNQQQQRILQNAELQARVQEIEANREKALKEEGFDFAKSLVDAEYDYRLAKANEIQAVQLRLEKQLATSRLTAAISVENALLRMQEARLRTSIAKQKVEAAKQFDALQEQQASAVPGTLPGAPDAPVLPPPSGGGQSFQPSSKARALMAAAQTLGVSPLDLATIIGFETAGSYSPSQWGGEGGNYMGLIQFGGPERRQYGANANQSFEEQVQGPVVRYFQDRFRGVGMSTQGATLEDLYTTVLAGNPRANRNARDSFGTSPRSGVAAMGAHRQRALQMFFGGSMANVGAVGPMSGPAFSVEKRAQSAEDEQIIAQSEEDATRIVTLARLNNELQVAMQQARVDIAQAIGTALPVEQLRLENELLAKRTELLLQGVPEEVVEGEEKRLTALRNAEGLQAAVSSSIEKLNANLADYKAKVAEGGPDQAAWSGAVKRTEEALAMKREELARIAPELQRYNLEVLKNTLAQLQNADALKRVRETIETIERAVGDAMGSYKNFLVNVARGEGLTKSLKEFQNALRDQALTMFFDFAMKPMQKFLEDELKKVFNLPIEDQVRQEQIRKLQEQINATTANTTAINANTSAQGGTPTVFTGAKADAGDFIPFTGGRGETEINKPFNVDLRATAEAEESARAASESIYQLGATLPGLSQGAHRLTSDFATSATKTWQQNLGATVQAIGMATASITSITAGISQIKKGGTSNVLTGIGSIMMGVGGALGGFSRLFPGATPAVPVQAAANGAVWQGGFRAFANGGVVNGPTLGLVGEGKYNEAIVPLPDGRSIPVKMAGDSSARSIMESNGQSSKNAPSTLSLSFETTKIGGVEYVSREQLELAMAATRKEAVREGASRGMNMTMDKIKNSPSTRNSLGMGRR